MGLLGDDFNDPRTMATLALAGSLMGGRSFGQGLLGGVQSYQGLMANDQEMKLKKQISDAQLANYQSEIQARNLATIKDQRQQELIQSVFDKAQQNAVSPGAFAPSADGMGPTMPPQMRPQSSGGALGSMVPDDIARLKRGGLDLTDIYKFSQEPQKLEQGSTYKDRNTGAERFMPKVGEGISADSSGFYNPLPGYANAQATIEGAKSGAVEAAKAGFDLVKVVGQDSAERYVPRSTVLGGPSIKSPQGSGEAGMRAAASGGMGADPAGIQREINAVQNDLMKPLDATSKAALTAHLAELRQSQKAVPMPTDTPGGFQATPTTTQKLSAEAGGKINETWLKTSYEPVKVAGDAANDMLTNVQVARQSMRAMPGGTGWGAESKATGAAILTSLGVAPKNAELYASNAQTFQSASMSNLQTVLNAAKGPQTEGDADRAGKTFAQLKNTPRANEFILDLSEAKAQRDQVKAQFYEQALPIARGKGDLQEVDREWRKRAPSVFSMPTMQKWGTK